MKTFLLLDNKREREIPQEFRSNDNRNPESLVRYFLDHFTKKGDRVFDPFAGLGTTLVVSEEMGRIPYGIEHSKKRSDYIKSQMKVKDNLIHGDSLKLDSYGLDKFDFCFTSPPYIVKQEERNPLTGSTEHENAYTKYLEGIGRIFSLLKPLMINNAHIVVEVSNLKIANQVTTLAWDISKEISEVFHFEGEIIVGWKGEDSFSNGGTYGYGYDHSYCLIFKNN